MIYEKPIAEVIILSQEDIVLTSGIVDDGSGGIVDDDPSWSEFYPLN